MAQCPQMGMYNSKADIKKRVQVLRNLKKN